MKYNRIGVFDSGIGGLTVLKDLLDLVPGVDMIYLGDSARLPYGSKSPRTVMRYATQCARFLVAKDIDMLVVACNTASAHSIPELERTLDIPVVGVIAAGARAAVDTGGKRIGVIATRSTIRSRAYVDTIKSIAPEADVFTKACPLFVPLVEEGCCDDEVTRIVARRYLAGLKEARVDTLLLGCTHYPLIKSVISEVMGPDVRIVDSAYSTASMVAGMLDGECECGRKRDVVYYLSDLSAGFIGIGESFLGREMRNVYEVDLGEVASAGE